MKLILPLLLLAATLNAQIYVEQKDVTDYVNRLQSDNDSIVKANTLLNGQIILLNSDIGVLNQQIISLNQVNSALGSQIQTLTTQNQSQAQQILSLTQQLADCQQAPPEPIEGPLPGATYLNDWTTLYDSQLGLSRAIAGTGSITENDMSVIRSTGSKSLHFVSNGVRCEVHTKFRYLGVGEGSTVYLGWSDYYVRLPINLYTVWQFRDQDQNITGCPSIQFGMASSYWDLGTVNGEIVRIKEGYAARASLIKNMRTGVWYDFVVAIKYAKDNTGYMTIWAGEVGTLKYDTPVFTYSGPTMYRLADLGTQAAPCDYSYTQDYFNSPHLRIGGCYQWGTVSMFESYKGPLRINVGETGKTAFYKVIPR